MNEPETVSAGQRAGPTLTVRGNPTDQELAAVVVVLAAGSSASSTARAGSTGQWAAYWRGLGAQIQPGPDAWRQSARP